MQLWKTGERSRVDGYLEARGLWRHELFARVVQALIELAEAGSEERALLESIQNHLRTGAAANPPRNRASCCKMALRGARHWQARVRRHRGAPRRA